MKRWVLISLSLLLTELAFAGGSVEHRVGSGGGAVKFQVGSGGGTVRYSLGLTEPINFTFISASTNTLGMSWTTHDLTPAPTNYSLQISSNANFSPVAFSSDTVNQTSTTTATLSVNKIYYGRVRGTAPIFDPSPWSGVRSTATLAAVPVTVASTWTMVGLSSVTAAWGAGDNPSPTQYVCNLSTVSGFGSGTTMSSTTFNLNATFTGLSQGVTYYARVKAVNWSGLSTSFFTAGSTVTQIQTTFVTDTFTDTNGTLLTSHTSDSGNTWTNGSNFVTPGFSGDMQIQSNTAQSFTSGNPIAYVNATPADADYDVTVDCQSTAYCGGPAGRVDNTAGDAYICYYAAGGANRWELSVIDNQVQNTIGTFSGDVPTTNRTITLRMTGSTISCIIGGVSRISVTDTAVTATGVPGINGAGSAEILDNFSATN